MKLLSVIVPCYNAQDYMQEAIDSLLVAGEELEIIIVNDGSHDETGIIAKGYAEAHPQHVIAIDQENKGHGGAVMTGLYHASGRYVRVLDSDDHMDRSALLTVMQELKRLTQSKSQVDMVVTNFIYDKVGKRHKKRMSYKNVFPERVVCRWNDLGHFRMGQYILMHSVTFEREFLLSTGLRLPEHTFYVDNLFVYLPLQKVQTMYYINVDLYRYFIGREDQSVNERVMCSRIGQQLKVTKMMIDHTDPMQMEEPKKRNYLVQYQGIILTVSSILLLRIGSDWALLQKEKMWQYVSRVNPKLYDHLLHSMFAYIAKTGKSLRKLNLAIYRIVNKFYGFN